MSNKPHYDFTLPDSRVTPTQYKQRQDRLDKFQRRAANPKRNAKYYREADRLKIIDELVSLRVRPEMVDCILACLKWEWWKPGAEERIKRAIASLTGDEIEQRREAEPLTDPDEQDVDSYIAKLSEREDPLAGYWSDDDECYVIGFRKDRPDLRIDKDDWLHAKLKTPEPGDIVIIPTGNGCSFMIGSFVSSEGNLIAAGGTDGLFRHRAAYPPLVVTRIQRDGCDS